MSLLQNRIVNSLTNSFILNRAIDPNAVAGVLGKEFPEVEHAQLIRNIKQVATSIGLRSRSSD
jgi:hypothetical protein